MANRSPAAGPRRVGPVDPDLLAAAVAVFTEHLGPSREASAGGSGAEALPAHTPAVVLELFAEDLGADAETTRNLYLRTTALLRLVSSRPELAGRVLHRDEVGGAPSEPALAVAARLDLVSVAVYGPADFDPEEFRAALERANA